MKRISLMFAFLVVALFASPVVAIDECFTGSWYDTSTEDGRGIDIQVLPNDRVAGYFYTWFQNDSSIDRELFLIVANDAAEFPVTFAAYQSLFTSTYNVGTAKLELIDNDHMIFSHNWKHDHHNTDNTMRWCFSDCIAEYEYTRLTQPIPCE